MARYTIDEYQALIEEVDNQGGVHMDQDKCVGEVIKDYKIKDRQVPATTCSCENNSIFLVPYDGENPDSAKINAARLCAVCDSMGWMPRFRGAMPETFETC